ncbi:MAG TPA: hypothetical protein VGD00_07575 [Solirubrobacteraceae bacterium]
MLSLLGGGALGIWGSRKLGVDTRPAALREGARMRRGWRRDHLSRGERVVLRAAMLSTLLAAAGIFLLVFGGRGARTGAIVLLALGLLVTAVPVSPFLRARLRRRERNRDQSEDLPL